MMGKGIALVVAYGKRREIGLNGDMPWGRSLPGDLQNFRKITTGHVIVMGRTTFASIGSPLSHRRNIVMSRSQAAESRNDVEFTNSLDAIIDISLSQDVFVIGGAQIYRLFLPHARRILATEILAEFAADTYFPEIDSNAWQETARMHNTADEINRYSFDFVEYVRISSV